MKKKKFSKSNDDTKVNFDSSINNKLNIKYNKQEERDKGNKIEIEYIDYEINNMSYEEALENDKRTFFQYYISLLKINHILLFTFIHNKDYNSNVIKICLFLFSFSLNLIVNTFFF